MSRLEDSIVEVAEKEFKNFVNYYLNDQLTLRKYTNKTQRDAIIEECKKVFYERKDDKIYILSKALKKLNLPQIHD